MSGWGKLEGLAVDLIKGGLEDVARFVVHKLRGDATDDTAKEVIEMIVRRALEAALRELEDEVRVQADKLGLTMALLELGPLTAKVLDAFEPKGTFPRLGIEVETVDEITEADREAERKRFDELKTDPGDKP